MHLAKKYLLSFLFIIGLGILQLNTALIIAPAFAESSLMDSQGLLKNSAAGAYGSSPKDVKIVALDLLQTALSFLAILSVAFILFAGFKYMTSGGNEAKTKEALDQIKAWAIGLLIILAAWGITKYVIMTILCRLTQTGTVCPVSYW